MAAAGDTLSIYMAYYKVDEVIGRAVMEALEITDDDRYSLAAGLTDDELEEVMRSILSDGEPLGFRVKSRLRMTWKALRVLTNAPVGQGLP